MKRYETMSKEEIIEAYEITGYGTPCKDCKACDFCRHNTMIIDDRNIGCRGIVSMWLKEDTDVCKTT